jgi:hypothetical protein
MAYSTFTMAQLRKDYHIVTKEQSDLFTHVAPVPVSDWLKVTLDKQTETALRSGSDKARSEYLIAPIMQEVHDQSRDHANLFSGVEFKVDESRGLTGFCDFIFTLEPRTIEFLAPVVSVVEAKKEDINGGIPQCIAELIAAQIFNDQEGVSREVLYGIVTTGTDWKFLEMRGTNVIIDGDIYFLADVEKVVGIVLSMLK